MTLLVGLGNPGRDHAGTRHNIGRVIVARAADRWSIPLAPCGPARQGSGLVSDCPVVLALPDTFMNLSGKAVASLCLAHTVRSRDVIVVHDDLDLPVGRMRVRFGGGSGGHRGIGSVSAALGDDAFVRVKIGIGRPAPDVSPADFVLASFTPAEREQLVPVLSRAVDSLECVVRHGVREAMNRYNRRVSE